MRSILVFGATGAIGRHLLPQLLARGERVTAISRHPPASNAQENRIQWLRGDLFAQMPAPPSADVVYSLGPLDAFADWFARTAISAAPKSAVADALPRRVIAFSSMSAQSKQDSIDASERDLAARLRAAETRVFETARAQRIACTIFRPTLIYGSGVDRSLAPLARFARRWRVLPIPTGASGLRQPVHAADLADACVAVCDNAATFDKTYELGGGERLRFDALLVRIAVGPPRIALALRVPLALVRMGLRLLQGPGAGVGALARLGLPLTADNAAATRDFGYAPRHFQAQEVLPAAAQNPARNAPASARK